MWWRLRAHARGIKNLTVAKCVFILNLFNQYVIFPVLRIKGLIIILTRAKSDNAKSGAPSHALKQEVEKLNVILFSDVVFQI